MRLRTARGLVTAIIISCAAACTASSRAPDAMSLSCDNPIETLSAPASPQSNILDAVALDTNSTLQANEAGGSDPHRLFAKTALIVHAGSKATLSLPSDWTSRASITWGNTATTWTTSLQIPNCPSPSDQGQWLVYPGGFSVDAPACVPLEVRAGGKVATIHVSVGISCL